MDDLARNRENKVNTELIDQYCQVWNEFDPAVQSNLLSQVWASQATYTDPTVHTVGHKELLNHIAKVRARRPGAKVLRTTNVDIHHGIARFGWHVVEADGTELPEGIDIVYFSEAGKKIEKIVGFFGPTQSISK